MHLREAKDAEEVEAVRAPACTSRPPTTSCGRRSARHDRGRDQRPRRVRMMRRGGASTASRTSSSAPTRPTRTARPASASSRWATSSSPTSPASSTATGATSRAARPPARRATGRSQAWEVVHEAYVAAVAMTRLGSDGQASTRPSATSSRPTRSSAPACTARGTRSAPRSTSRRSSSATRTSRCARA